MSGPSAENLFLNIWGIQMGGDDTVQPGSKGWDKGKVKHWAQVWMDCKELADHINQIEQTGEKLKDIAKTEETKETEQRAEEVATELQTT